MRRLPKIVNRPPRTDGRQDAYAPPAESYADNQAREEEFRQKAFGHRCQVCRNPILVAHWWDHIERRHEYYLRCSCYPKEPEIYKPETPVEFYRRTGTGDAVVIMQEERRRKHKVDQDLMLARIEDVERMDEDQIIQELAGDKAKEYVYSFQMDGKTVKGLSWAGYKELLIRWGNVRIERPFVEDLGDSLRAIVEATDMVHNVTVWAGTHQMKKRKISGREGRPDKWIDDDYAFEKVVSKAQRNVVKNVIPHAVQQAAIEAVLTGKAIPIGRYTEEAPSSRLPASQTKALPEKPVDGDGVIQEERPDFKDKGEAMGWYNETHGLGLGAISDYYPEGAQGIQDLTLEQLVEAAEKALAERESS